VNAGLDGAPGHGRFVAALTGYLRRAPRERQAGALVVRLSHCQETRQAQGHRAADALVVQLAARIRAILRERDHLERIAADALAVVLPELAGSVQAELAAVGILQSRHGAFVIEGQALRPRLQLGLALAPDHATTADALQCCAERAVGENGPRHAGYPCTRLPPLTAMWDWLNTCWGQGWPRPSRATNSASCCSPSWYV
jgi:GGDEF domain-containing protein